MRSQHPELAGPAKRCLGALDTVSWPWIPVLGSLEPPRRDGENAQKTGKNGGKMGEIRPKTCEQGRERRDHLECSRQQRAAQAVQVMFYLRGSRSEATVKAEVRQREPSAPIRPVFHCSSSLERECVSVFRSIRAAGSWGSLRR